MYAKIVNDQVLTVGYPPDTFHGDDRWYDLRPRDPEVLALAGWLPLVRTDRPANTATSTYELGYDIQDDRVVEVWTIRPWTQAELAQRQADAEREARAVEDAAILDAVRATSVPASAEGDEWMQPTGAHDAYPLGAERTHGGKAWVSLVPFNVWEPGVSGWREVTSGGPAAWMQPTGAHDAYPLGATVTHSGKEWESLTPFNVWEPGIWGWREVEAEGGEPPAWVQPTGAHDSYQAGARVTHNGQVWTNTHGDGNIWEPGAYGWTVE